jgi:hypothetical protein
MVEYIGQYVHLLSRLDFGENGCTPYVHLCSIPGSHRARRQLPFGPGFIKEDPMANTALREDGHLQLVRRWYFLNCHPHLSGLSEVSWLASRAAGHGCGGRVYLLGCEPDARRCRVDGQ